MPETTDIQRLNEITDYMLRHYKAKTKGEMAKIVGYSRSHFQNILSGRDGYNITPKLVDGLKKHYDVNPDYIRMGEDPMLLSEKKAIKEGIDDKSEKLDIKALIRHLIKHDDQLIDDPEFRDYVRLTASVVEVKKTREAYNKKMS